MMEGNRIDAGMEGVFHTPDGLRAWKRENVSEAATDLAAQNYAIVFGEVWVVEGSLFSALSPRRDGGWAVFSWESPARQIGEPWDQYVDRSLRETLNAVGRLRAEEEIAAEVGNRIYYHLSYIDEAGYHRAISTRRNLAVNRLMA